MDISACAFCAIFLFASLLHTGSARPLDEYLIDQEIGKLQDTDRMEMLEKLLYRLIPSEDGENLRNGEDLEDDRSLQNYYDKHLKDLHVSTRSHSSSPVRYSNVFGTRNNYEGSRMPLRIAGSKRNFDRNGWGGGYGKK
uniref:GYamide neuropeptide n=1 Tax=Platynereis dumerilii TaxID=6359 RepID=V5TE05_PLADU|nr:GYamide neuropeptide precursor [Platynereis dumerilii]